MKNQNLRIWIACIVVFAVLSPQNAAAFISTSAIHTKAKFCETKFRSMTYMKKIAKSYGHQRVKEMGWSNREWKALLILWTRESRWDYKAKNPHSTAYGIAQMLDFPHNSSVKQQIDAGLKYIKNRYKTPTLALRHHYYKGWY